jgi:hypothetical protein
VVISDYLEIISATKSAVHHLSSLNTEYVLRPEFKCIKSADRRLPPTGLIILEPEMTPGSSLPIFPPDSLAKTDGIPKQSREKHIKIHQGLERILGQGHCGGIVPAR